VAYATVAKSKTSAVARRPATTLAELEGRAEPSQNTGTALAHREPQSNSRAVAILASENAEHGVVDLSGLEEALVAIRRASRNKPLDIIVIRAADSSVTGTRLRAQ